MLTLPPAVRIYVAVEPIDILTARLVHRTPTSPSGPAPQGLEEVLAIAGPMVAKDAVPRIIDLGRRLCPGTPLG